MPRIDPWKPRCLSVQNEAFNPPQIGEEHAEGQDAPVSQRPNSRFLVYSVATCFVLSGAGSLVLEVVWSRHLKLLFGSTTLAISTILVTYMLGLGLGALAGGWISDRLRNGVRVYGLLEIGVGVYALAVPLLLQIIGALSTTALTSGSFWPVTLARFAGSLGLMLLPTLAMGATLPVLVETLVADKRIMGERVGLLYGINTAGAVIGVLLATFLLFPRLGLAWSNRVGAGLDIAAGLIAAALIAPRAVRTREERRQHAKKKRTRPAAASNVTAPAWVLIGLVSYALVGFTALVYEVTWTRTLSMVLGSSIYAFSAMLAAFLGGIALGSLAARRWIDRMRDLWFAYAVSLGLLGLLALGTMTGFGRLPDAFLAIVRRGGLEGSSMITASFVLSSLVMIGPTLVLGWLFPLASRAIAEAGEGVGWAVGATYFANTIGSALGAFAGGFLLIPLIGVR
ncbi:MAG: fused MFS/spermidine synthase, partial [Acidobacteriota bacterium]